MGYRWLGAALVAVIGAVVLTSAPTHARDQWYSGEGYDWWTDCTDVPDPLEFLPIYLGNESPGFVDLRRTIQRNGVSWRVMQYTRDKDLGVTRIAPGRWYGAMGADEWPAGSPFAERHLSQFRVTAWEIDGNRQTIDPACVMVLHGDDHTIGFYNAWVRFNEPGVHTVRVFGKQLADFFFTWEEPGLSDPFGLEGRRVFLAGESVGDVLDDEFTHSYELHVGRY